MSKKKSAKRFACIHGHFYQPYRKNPQTEEIDLQEGAYPYKDWNEKINDECYRANAFAHILGKEDKLTDVFNNYTKISFNFGPTLLEWIKENDALTYEKIIEADKSGQEFFSGHGTAIAQTYSHLIMPLANRQDKILQIYWAIYDFEKNFNRKPEGMWLAETAVDYKTLEILAEFGIKYTILSPFQAYRYRKIQKISKKSQKSTGEKSASEKWISAETGNINTRRPYLCRLPSKKEIVLFFYDREISTAVSFGNLLKNGEDFAQAIIHAPYNKETSGDKEEKEIIIIASDGEVYGHHKKFGEMALAYCLKTLMEDKNTALTVLGEYLDLFPPIFEAEIIENTAWSCSHFLSRWEGGCSCGLPENNSEGKWSSEWRARLRQATGDAREEFDKIYRDYIKKYVRKEFSDILQILKDYITVTRRRDYGNIRLFLNKYSEKNNILIKKSHADRHSLIHNFFTEKDSLLLSLLEMQRQAILMQSSDAWFFDDISRIEAVQIFRHLLMAVRLSGCFDAAKAKKILRSFLNILKSTRSNIYKNVSGFDIFIREATGKKYSTEKITADFIAYYFNELAEQKELALTEERRVFAFYNHEFILTNVYDLEDDYFSGKSGGLYIISKTTLRKEFCSFFFVAGKPKILSEKKKNESLRILVRKKNAGNNNNYRYSPETNDFNGRIKKSLKSSSIKEIFYALKNKPGFRYFELKDISNRIKINFFRRTASLKLRELESGLTGYRLYTKSIDENMRKWINTDLLKNDDDLLNNILVKSRIFITLNKEEVSKRELKELDCLINADNFDFSFKGPEILGRDSSTDFLSASAGKLAAGMVNKYIKDISEIETLLNIIKLLKIYQKLELKIDFLKMQNALFEVKKVFDAAGNIQKYGINKKIQDDITVLFEKFKIEYREK